MFKNINKAEWKFLAAVWIIVVFIVFWPIVIGFFMTPSGSVFLFRPILNNDDYAVYFSQINQAKHGIYF
ncbi:MAG: hypothetical protein NT094_02635, partial [Candidatus Staskawiczbacteria bacterium]|nr:hypothetical protein [Candidatus Staskawiczbacteria bacterium]